MKSQNWKTVKLEGKLITDDSTGSLDGLIGLEVLEGYDKSMVQKSKKRRKTKSDQLEAKKCKADVPVPAKETLTAKPQKKKTQKIEEIPSEAGKFVLAPPADEEVDYYDTLPDWQAYNLPNPILKALYENGFNRPTEIQRLTLPPAILGRRDILGAAETGSGKTLAFGLPILSGILYLKEQWKTNPDYSIRRTAPAKKGETEEGVEPVDEEEPSIEESDQDVDDEEQAEDEADDDEEDEDDENEEDLDDDLPGENKPLFAVILAPTRELAIQVRDHIRAVAKYTGIKVAAIVGGMAIVKQKRVLKGCPEIVVATPGRLWELLKEGDPHLSKINDIQWVFEE